MGCIGLSTAYYLTSKGLKVLGLEKFSNSGSIGTSSFGDTRIWRFSHSDDRYTNMMGEALEIWREVEQKTGKELIVKTGLLWVFDPNTHHA